jgi:hypothetical protein
MSGPLDKGLSDRSDYAVGSFERVTDVPEA